MTNFLAVKMLFHPREPISILGLKIQGIFPKRRAVLADKLARLVSTELFSKEDMFKGIERTFNDPEMSDKLAPGLTRFITEDLPKHVPILAMMLTPELVESLKGSFMAAMPKLLERVSAAVPSGQTVNKGIEDTVRLKVLEFSTEKLEDILNSILKKEFRFIEIVGAVLGFFYRVCSNRFARRFIKK